jgi:hypothetical protein
VLFGHQDVKLFLRRRIFSKTEKLRTGSKITPLHLNSSSKNSLAGCALDFLSTFSSMEKVEAMRLEIKKSQADR